MDIDCLITYSAPLGHHAFFELFGVTSAVADEDDDARRKQSDKEGNVYKADVVYGTSSSFIFDIVETDLLKHSKAGRGERPYDFVIIDEVDNLLIDTCDGQCLMHSGQNCHPGLDHATFLLIRVLVWLTHFRK